MVSFKRLSKTVIGFAIVGCAPLSFYSFTQSSELSETFIGITNNGTPMENLFPIQATGIDTSAITSSAENFIASLTTAQQQRTLFPIDHAEWRKWSNRHRYDREGISFEEMTQAQREAAFALLQTSLSAKGYDLARDVMRLNHTLAELTNNNFEEYGEFKYHLSLMGTPSATEPWGWQLDGHHLIINYFVLGDQIVMTPAFYGSEPVMAESGKYKGVSILQEEQSAGLKLINMFDESQKQQAILSTNKSGNEALAQAFSDNLVLDYAGINAKQLSNKQTEALLNVIDLYIKNMPRGAATVKMEEVTTHLNETYFTWIGGTGKDDVFYYRIQSPVLLIEFDHQNPIALRHIHEPGVPTKAHVHSVVRTPNGNDYGKDLLRQHYQDHHHDHQH